MERKLKFSPTCTLLGARSFAMAPPLGDLRLYRARAWRRRGRGGHALLQDALVAQVLEAAGRYPELVAEHLVVVLAEGRASPADRAGGGGEAGEHALHREVAEDLVGDADDGLAGGDVRVGHHVPGAVDEAGGHVGAAQPGYQLPGGELAGPGGDQVVQLGLVRPAGAVGGV